ncbi:MAG: hypothetical protein JW791_00975 [Nanoarchaeota archaeon]|nr:hypothetical protein [Nanoarchaeota archaeon]
MPVEGISMTTVFSLLTVGLALSISAFIGGYFLQPTFDIAAVMAGVAYDIATMYDLAYTMPGEVTINYYGPSACLWNYNQPGDESTSFHCFSGDAVVIRDVLLNTQKLYVYNDPYVNYDYNTKDFASPGAISFPRPAFLSVEIPYYNAQLCPFSTDTFSYCDQAYAPFAASYKDADMMTAQTPYSIKVEDWSFVVSKYNVGDYYNTLYDDYYNPSTLATFLEFLADTYNKLCEPNGLNYLLQTSINCDTAPCVRPYRDSPVNEEVLLSYRRANEVEGTSEGYFLQLLKGYKWSIYNETIICQERLIIDENYVYENGTIDNTTNFEGLTVNSYVTDYCFNIENFVLRNPCDNIESIIFDPSFIELVNNGYTYYASVSSCLKPYLTLEANSLIIKGVDARFNYLLDEGACDNR